jgi:nicotinate-nucleotide adenylyltransferase
MLDSLPVTLLEAESVLVYGGTFDPPTLAHIELPMIVRERLGIDLVAYVPAAVSPFKTAEPPTGAEHRVAMLEAVLDDNPHAKVLTEEIDRAEEGRPSFTVDTVEWLRDFVPAGVPLRLLIGGDQMATFGKWRSYERIVEIADPVVMLRAPQTREALLAEVPEWQRGFWAPRLIDVPAMDVSASEVRRRVAAGESIRDLVPAAVERYIRKHRLYRA